MKLLFQGSLQGRFEAASTVAHRGESPKILEFSVTAGRRYALKTEETAMEEQDLELARRAGRGDTVALEALYRRFVGRVWRYGYLRTRSRDAAAEIVQETFLRVARSVSGFKGRSSLSTWLFAVARSAAVHLSLKERRHRLGPDDPQILRLLPDEASRSDPLEADETRRAVRAAIVKLPGAQRDAIVLCELCGFCIREAAEALGWGESRVKVTLFRARRRLRDLLRDYLGEEKAGVRREK